MKRSFATRLTWVLALLLLGYGGFVALLGRQVAAEQEQEALQRLSQGLAGHIVAHWPAIAEADREGADRAAREALLAMLMTVNPAVQVYLLDADGQVQHYIGEPGMVREPQVDLVAVRRFLAGGTLPLRGTDPMGSGVPRIFSAAMFARRVGDTRPPGYLYIVLDGRPREQVQAQLGAQRVWRGAALAAAIGALVTLAVGGFTLRRLTLPLHRLAGRLRDYRLRHATPDEAMPMATAPRGDEVRAIDAAFAEMAQRIDAQAEREQRLAGEHREMMASVAHDLRTPLTALHGHLEALASSSSPDGGAVSDDARRERLLAAALQQSRKVGRLSQQLFEMASLHATGQVLHVERFCLDELVSDAVQKFELSAASPSGAPRVTLDGAPPGRVAVDGDLQLIERALGNLIDNALRHAPGAAPVRVSLRRSGATAEIVVEDGGPGLPGELAQRLDAGLSLREPPIRRSGGGIGGLGMAIAQRVAVLHGGSLRCLPSPAGGTRLCLALPLA